MNIGELSEGNHSGDSDSSHCDLRTVDSASDGVLRARPARANSMPHCLVPAPSSNRLQQRRREQQGRAQSQRLPDTQESSSSDEGSEMDADCCGDSGALPLLLS